MIFAGPPNYVSTILRSKVCIAPLFCGAKNKVSVISRGKEQRLCEAIIWGVFSALQLTSAFLQFFHLLIFFTCFSAALPVTVFSKSLPRAITLCIPLPAPWAVIWTFHCFLSRFIRAGKKCQCIFHPGSILSLVRISQHSNSLGTGSSQDILY